MILSFDKFENYEAPQITLCNPNSRATNTNGKITITDTVGILSNPSGMDLKLNFNAPHELSFNYYRHKSDDPIKQSFYDSLFDAIQTDRYVYLTDIGYFVISNVSDSDEDNIDKKSITCKSCEENEFSTAEGLYLEEGTYQLHTQDNKGLLDLFLPKTAGWTLSYIDPSLLETDGGQARYYYVEKTDIDNGYNFLYTTIQDMCECIVESDIIARTISVYSRAYYTEHHLTDIHIAKYNLLKHKTVEENDEDKYTALNVQGKDENLEIRVVNPTGKNVIYNFEPRYAWMSSDLQVAVEKWQEKCESAEARYLRFQKVYYNALQVLFNEEQDIEVLKGQLKELIQTQEFVVSGDYDKEQYETQQAALDAVNGSILAKQIAINTATENYNIHKTNVHTHYEEPITQINSDCALDITAVDIDGNLIFTQDLLNELMTHIKPTDYVDEYMLVTDSMTYPQIFEKAKELMDRAKAQLVKISSGKKTYSIDTRSFLFNKQFKYFSEQLCAGAIIYVETKNDTMEQLHLTGIDINFDEKSTNFTLGNKYDRSDLKALYDEALGKNSKTFNELKYIASIIEDQQNQLDYQKNWVAELRTLTLGNVLTSEDQAIEINNRGLIGRKRQLNQDGSWKEDENGNPLFELEQVKLINNCLIFTDDNWHHAKTAVGKIAVGYDEHGNVQYAYGINGQVLIGELILGNNLVLTGTGAGIQIKDSSGNDVFYADDNGNLVLSGTIFAQHGEIGGWNIDTYLLESTNGTKNVGIQSYNVGATAAFAAGYSTGFAMNTAPFYVTHNGYLHTSNGDIGGWEISSDYLYGEYNGNACRITTNPSHYGYWIAASRSGESFNRFYIDTTGTLHATGADISGIINAQAGGFIGGWNINSNGIGHVVGGVGNVQILSDATLATDLVMYVTQSDVANANFKLTLGGHLTCTGANITGTIQANSVIANGAYFGANKYLKITETTNNQQVTLSHTNTTKADMRLLFSQGYIELGRNLTYVGINAGNTLAPNGQGTLAGTWVNNSGVGITSDENLKNNINPLNDEKYDEFYNKIKPVIFYYNDGTSGRKHTGFIAQQIEESIIEAGLSTNDYALTMKIIDEQTGSETYYLRYTEIIAFNTWQIQKLKSRVATLESTVAQLQTQIQTLTAG